MNDWSDVYAAEPGPARGAVILAHGAGAGRRHPFMTTFARAIAARGVDVITFDFPYIVERRRLPDRAPVLERAYREMIDTVRREIASAAGGLAIGGKSMGGRIATQVAASDTAPAVDGLVLLGYPLHPPNRPQQRRDAHLPSVARPMAFVQGTRDPFASEEEIRGLVESLPAAALHVVRGGDHSFRVPRTASQAEADRGAQDFVAAWLERLFSKTSPSAAKP